MRADITIHEGSPYPLGLTVVNETRINLAAVLFGREECGVILYPRKGGSIIRFPFSSRNRVGNIYCMALEGIRAEDYAYNFYKGDQVITDPYAKGIRGNERWGSSVDPTLKGCYRRPYFDWGEDCAPLTPLCDSFLYLIHVRGFTKHPSSGVCARGTFAGIIEKLPYLLELGVTAVELMPAYEFIEMEREKPNNRSMAEAVAHLADAVSEEVCRINYWGYKKGYYFAPKASYAAGDDPALEFKEMVRAFHQKGLEVIMQFYFPGEVKGGYILEVLKYWVYEYHVDGFHLLGEKIPTTLAALEPMLSNTKLFYYDFSCSEIYDTQEAPEYKNLACYRDDFMYDCRRFLKGDEGMLGKALWQLKKNPPQTGVINYMANYEGFSLADMVAYERRHNEKNGENNRDGNPYNASWNCGHEGKSRKKSILQLRQKQLRNAVLLLLTAQGTPMLVAGDEFGQSREGNNNAWCQDNGLSWLNWKLVERNQGFWEFVKKTVRLRREHPILHLAQEMRMMDYTACGYPDLSYHSLEPWRLTEERISREAGVMYCGKYARIGREKEDDFFYIAYNMHWEEKRFALPALPAGWRWRLEIDSAGEDSKEEFFDKTMVVEARSIRILKSVAKKARGEKKT